MKHTDKLQNEVGKMNKKDKMNGRGFWQRAAVFFMAAAMIVPGTATLAEEDKNTPVEEVPSVADEKIENSNVMKSEDAKVEATKAPKEKEEPKAAEEPKATEAPKATEEPKATEAPKATEEPKVTEAPKATEEPKVTEAPKATEEPKATEAPKVTEEPKVTEAPKATEESKATKEPKATETPKATEEPEITETPSVTEEPVQDDAETEERNLVRIQAVTADHTAARVGESITVTLDITVKNAQGTALEPFVLEIGAGKVAECSLKHTVVNGAVVRDGKLYVNDKPLTITFNVTPFAADQTEASITVRIKDTDEEQTRLWSGSIQFELIATEEQAEEQPEEPTEEVTEGHPEEPTEEVTEGQTEEQAEEETSEETSADEADEEADAEENGDEAPADVQEETNEVTETPAGEDAGEEAASEENIPVEEETLETVEDEVPQEQPISLKLVANGNKDEMEVGDTLTLTAVITGLEEGSYTIWWQTNEDGQWRDIPGSEGMMSYSLVITEENVGTSLHYCVEVPD